MPRKSEKSDHERLQEYEQRSSSLKQLARMCDRQAEQLREKLNEREHDKEDHSNA
jgi:hypothetical protein